MAAGFAKYARVLSVAVAILLGAVVGIGGFTFSYGDGAAYLSDDPAACTNCHVMQGHYDSWLQSGHRHVAVCNDCHLPPDAVGKWVTKADNGFLHSLVFTTGDFPDEIRIKDRNARRTQAACLKCHQDLVHTMAPAGPDREHLACVHCHQAVGHAQR